MTEEERFRNELVIVGAMIDEAERELKERAYRLELLRARWLELYEALANPVDQAAEVVAEADRKWLDELPF